MSRASHPYKAKHCASYSYLLRYPMLSKFLNSLNSCSSDSILVWQKGNLLCPTTCHFTLFRKEVVPGESSFNILIS